MRKLLLSAALLLSPLSSHAFITTYDFVGTIETPTAAAGDRPVTWVHKVGDTYRGVLRIDSKALPDPDYQSDSSAIFKHAAAVDLEIGGKKFVGEFQDLSVSHRDVHLGTYVIAGDGIGMDIDFGFNKGTLNLTLAEAIKIVGETTGGISFDAWEGSNETNFGGGLDWFARRDSNPTPEPGTFVLMGSALLAFAGLRRRRL